MEPRSFSMIVSSSSDLFSRHVPGAAGTDNQQFAAQHSACWPRCPPFTLLVNFPLAPCSQNVSSNIPDWQF
jgi:hypothetical protein